MIRFDSSLAEINSPEQNPAPAFTSFVYGVQAIRGVFRPFARASLPQVCYKIDTFETPGGEVLWQFPILVSIKILAAFSKWSGARPFLQKWSIRAGESTNFVNHEMGRDELLVWLASV
jgi:hypothetical protein